MRADSVAVSPSPVVAASNATPFTVASPATSTVAAKSVVNTPFAGNVISTASPSPSAFASVYSAGTVSASNVKFATTAFLSLLTKTISPVTASSVKSIVFSSVTIAVAHTPLASSNSVAM